MLPESESKPEIHKTGHRGVDLIVASSAIFISLCSLALAIHHGRTMERLVEANSRPFLQFDSSNGEVRPNGELAHEISVTISNPGAGAARIERFSITLDGHSITDWPALVRALTAEAAAKHLVPDGPLSAGQFSYATVAPSFLKGGGEEVIFRWTRAEQNAALWDYVDTVRQSRRIDLQACYCSIFDQCWTARTASFRPEETKHCS
jgi:hypothetical protein